jgi:hypothetical protein
MYVYGFDCNYECGLGNRVIRVATDRTGASTVVEVAASPLIDGERQMVVYVFEEGRFLIASTCRPLPCGGYSTPGPEIRGRLLLSRDGGIRWTELFEGQGIIEIYDITNQGQILARGIFAPRGELTKAYWRLLNPEEPLPVPNSSPFSARFLHDGSVIWREEFGSDDVFGNDSRPLRTFAFTASDRFSGYVKTPDGGVIVRWRRTEQGPSGPYQHTYFGKYDRVGAEQWIVDLSDEYDYLAFGSPPESGLTPGALGIPFIPHPRMPVQLTKVPTYQVPVVIDFEAGTVQPIRLVLPESQAFFNRFGGVAAMAQGPFAVVAGAGDCLNMRMAPDPAAAVIDCFPDGVLFRDLDETVEAGGVTWLKISSPAGETGWASVAYLDRK